MKIINVRATVHVTEKQSQPPLGGHMNRVEYVGFQILTFDPFETVLCSWFLRKFVKTEGGLIRVSHEKLAKRAPITFPESVAHTHGYKSALANLIFGLGTDEEDQVSILQKMLLDVDLESHWLRAAANACFAVNGDIEETMFPLLDGLYFQVAREHRASKDGGRKAPNKL